MILGVAVKSQPSGACEFFYLVYYILRDIGNTNLMQLLIATLTIASLVVVKQCVNERFKYVICDWCAT